MSLRNTAMTMNVSETGVDSGKREVLVGSCGMLCASEKKKKEIWLRE